MRDLHFFKKWLAVAVAAVMAVGISLGSVQASAHEEENVIGEDTFYRVRNIGRAVLYTADSLCPEESEAAALSAGFDPVTRQNFEAAAAILRQQMVERKPEIKLEVQYNGINDGEVFGLLYEMAKEYTSEGDEGDYLAKTLGGASVLYDVKSGIESATWSGTIFPNYYTTAEQEKAVSEKIAAVLADLDIGRDNDYEKIRKIYNYIVDNVEYDYAHLNDSSYKLQYTAYAALIDGTAVCQGYAALFYRMAHEAGLSARVVSGQVDGGGHGWNMVRLGGLYYYIDTTFASSTGKKDDYFLKGRLRLKKHVLDESYTTDEFHASFPDSVYDYFEVAPGGFSCETSSVCRGTEFSWNAVSGASSYNIRVWEDERSGNALRATTGITGTGYKTALPVGSYTAVLEAVSGSSVSEVSELKFIVSLGHEAEIIPAKPATCTEPGMTAGKKCSVCGLILAEQGTISALGHQFDAGKVTVEATCTLPGSTVQTCSVCGKEIVEVIPATGHVFNKTLIYLPSCTLDGFTIHYCEKCDYTYKDSPVPAVGHRYGEGTVTKEATETEEGEMLYICTECGFINREVIPKIVLSSPHNPGTPDAPDTPDTPDSPDAPDTPDIPDTPDSPDTPDIPDTPDSPDAPDTPDIPDTPDPPVNEMTPVEQFVARLYRNFLGREPEAEGLAAWSTLLADHRATGAKAVYGFVYSDEFQANPLGNSAFVSALYETIFGRTAEEDGLAAWGAVLENGCTRKKVLAGFLNSDEMRELCDSLGIEAGSYRSDELIDSFSKITAFVARMYRCCLSRPADYEGLDAWVTALVKGSATGAKIANGFFFSDEMKAMQLTNRAFVANAYVALLGREPEEEGLDAWTEALDRTGDRTKIVRGFIGSDEFGAICEEYGIAR